MQDCTNVMKGTPELSMAMSPIYIFIQMAICDVISQE